MFQAAKYRAAGSDKRGALSREQVSQRKAPSPPCGKISAWHQKLILGQVPLHCGHSCAGTFPLSSQFGSGLFQNLHLIARLNRFTFAACKPQGQQQKQ